jgi:hypothetical protein
MKLINKNSSYYPWIKLVTLGFIGGVLGSYYAVFLLDFYNPLDLFVPPYKATAWACTCGFLGLSVVNSVLLTEITKRKLVTSTLIYTIVFLIHSMIFKFSLSIPGVGKLFEIAGWSTGFPILFVRKISSESKSRLHNLFLLTFSSLVSAFLFIGIRYFIGSKFIFEKPIDLEILFTWTLMCSSIGFCAGLDKFIP